MPTPHPEDSTSKKLIHEKTNRITWVPKNVEIRAIAMHANADNLVPMVLFPGFTKLKCRIIDSSVV